MRMCRNIKTLFNYEPPVTENEIHAAAVQFVRKISGFTRPSKANEAAFLAAVEAVAAASRQLLSSLAGGTALQGVGIALPARGHAEQQDGRCGCPALHGFPDAGHEPATSRARATAACSDGRPHPGTLRWP